MTRRSILLVSLAALQGNPVQWIEKSLENGEESHHWDSLTVSISMGSLLKPFLALAYSATHERYPAIYCAGSASGCWHARGHGEQHFVEALANSCNTYFLALTAMIDRAALDSVCLAYGLQAPARSLPAADLIGLGHGWPQSPLNVARAFASLAANAGETGARTVLAGMARCAKSGTARAVGVSCYAKTGTAPCSHLPRASGDGFAVAIYPLDQPRSLVLLQHHNTTGANAARDVGPLTAATV
jgi:cell division protein FtsI/penicillin-binding protein 2